MIKKARNCEDKKPKEEVSFYVEDEGMASEEIVVVISVNGECVHTCSLYDYCETYGITEKDFFEVFGRPGDYEKYSQNRDAPPWDEDEEEDE